MTQGPPHPSEHTSWPSWFYPPHATDDNAGEVGQVFASADDVPEGWLADWRGHGVGLDRVPRAPTAPEMSRLDLFRELKARDIPCSATLGTAALQRLYDEALEAEALEATI